jgi:hypothetical protein
MYALLTGLGLALPAGLNAYIPLLAIALADRYFGLINLAPPFDAMATPWGIGIITILLIIEVFADKVPLIDHANDLLNTAIRPAAGAILLMASTDSVSFINPIFAMCLGLVAAGSVHAVKAAVRPAVTATTGGVGNPFVSAAEDGAAIGLSIIALVAPILIALVIIGQTILILYLLRERRRRRALRSDVVSSQ